MFNKLKETFSPLLTQENLAVFSKFINGDIIDIHRPTTSLNNLRTSLEGTVSKIPDAHREKMGQSLLGLITDKEALDTMQQEYRKMINDLKKQIKDDKEASSLLDLIWYADKKIPFSPLIVFQHFLPEMEFYRRVMEPLDLFSQAGKSNDEAKVRALIRALRETAEMLYEPYLRALFQIAMLAEGKWSKGPENFGSLVKQTHEKLKSYPEIVEPNAGWLRNAASHAHWVYEVNKKTIIVWDLKV